MYLYMSQNIHKVACDEFRAGRLKASGFNGTISKNDILHYMKSFHPDKNGGVPGTPNYVHMTAERHKLHNTIPCGDGTTQRQRAQRAQKTQRTQRTQPRQRAQRTQYTQERQEQDYGCPSCDYLHGQCSCRRSAYNQFDDEQEAEPYQAREFEPPKPDDGRQNRERAQHARQTRHDPHGEFLFYMSDYYGVDASSDDPEFESMYDMYYAEFKEFKRAQKAAQKKQRAERARHRAAANKFGVPMGDDEDDELL